MIRLTPPTPRRTVSSGWGRPRAYRNGWHEGLDFPAPNGSPVLAAAAGVVTKVDDYDNSYAGRYIVVHHGGGMYTRYLHNTKNLVKVGQQVSRGQKIATLGQTGTSGRGAPHVHFDVKFKSAAHAAYEISYGKPTTGWGKSSAAVGRGVPGEAVMDGAIYTDAHRKWAANHGVVFYSGLGRNVLKAVAVLGAAYIGFRVLK
jgi:murein DD-endopeptidase MepM/ murein hydrolase activator NlpD